MKHEDQLDNFVSLGGDARFLVLMENSFKTLRWEAAKSPIQFRSIKKLLGYAQWMLWIFKKDWNVEPHPFDDQTAPIAASSVSLPRRYPDDELEGNKILEDGLKKYHEVQQAKNNANINLFWFPEPDKLRQLIENLEWFRKNFSDSASIKSMVSPLQGTRQHGGKPITLLPFYHVVPAILLHLAHASGKPQWNWITEWALKHHPRGDTLSKNSGGWDAKEWLEDLNLKEIKNWRRLPQAAQGLILNAATKHCNYVHLHNMERQEATHKTNFPNCSFCRINQDQEFAFALQVIEKHLPVPSKILKGWIPVFKRRLEDRPKNEKLTSSPSVVKNDPGLDAKGKGAPVVISNRRQT